MGLTQGLTLVFAVQSLCALCLVSILDVVILVGQEAGADDGLATTGDTATGATHDLDEVVLGLALADLVQQDLGVLHAVGNGDIDDGAVDVDGCLTQGDRETHVTSRKVCSFGSESFRPP